MPRLIALSSSPSPASSCSARASTSTPRRCWRRCCWSAPSTRPSPAAIIVKPWSWADTWPVARIEVKRLHASAIVLAGSSGQALAFGPGHVELTPDAGERGVAVYSAHRDTHFRFLSDVTIGDEIDVTRSDGRTFRYRADGTSVVRFDASGHRSLHRRPRTGAVDLLAVRCADVRTGALCPARHHDRSRIFEIAGGPARPHTASRAGEFEPRRRRPRSRWLG